MGIGRVPAATRYSAHSAKQGSETLKFWSRMPTEDMSKGQAFVVDGVRDDQIAAPLGGVFLGPKFAMANPTATRTTEAMDAPAKGTPAKRMADSQVHAGSHFLSCASAGMVGVNSSQWMNFKVGEM